MSSLLLSPIVFSVFSECCIVYLKYWWANYIFHFIFWPGLACASSICSSFHFGVQSLCNSPPDSLLTHAFQRRFATSCRFSIIFAITHFPYPSFTASSFLTCPSAIGSPHSFRLYKTWPLIFCGLFHRSSPRNHAGLLSVFLFNERFRPPVFAIYIARW